MTLFGWLVILAIVWWVLKKSGIAGALWTSTHSKVLARTISDEEYYRQAAEEVRNNIMREGLYAQAYAQAEGDPNRAQALYIKLRVKAMKAEMAAEIAEHLERNAASAAPPTPGPQPQPQPKPTSQFTRTTSGPRVTLQCPSCDGACRVPVGKVLNIRCPHCAFMFKRST